MIFSWAQSYITHKDLKKNFLSNINNRLINGGKSDIGLISKQFDITLRTELRMSWTSANRTIVIL